MRPFPLPKEEYITAATVDLVRAKLQGDDFRILPKGLPAWVYQVVPVKRQMDFLRALPEEFNADAVERECCRRALVRCLKRIGEGNESWRVDCRRVVQHAAETLQTRWLNDDEGERAERAERAAVDVAVRAVTATATEAMEAAAAAAAASAAASASAAAAAATTAATALAATPAAAALAVTTAAVWETWATSAAWAAPARGREYQAQFDDLMQVLKTTTEAKRERAYSH